MFWLFRVVRTELYGLGGFDNRYVFLEVGGSRFRR